MPPQSATAVQDPNYTPVDPGKNFLGFVMQNKEAISRMPEDAQLRFVDMLFRRFALSKYQQIDKNRRPLDEDEIANLRVQFAARLLGIPMDQTTQLKDEEVKHGTLAKGAAALEAGGAGVLGSFRTINELKDKFEKHIPIVGDYLHKNNLESLKVGSALESRAYEDARAVSPRIADISAGLGHQIVPSIAAGAVGKLPGAAKSAGLVAKAGIGAIKGAAEGATFEATRPGGDPASGAGWGGVLGAAFPLIGKLFGFGRGTTTKAAEAVGKGEGVPAAGAAVKAGGETASLLGDVANKVSKEKFGKAFKDLSPNEKSQMPSLMKEEIKKQQTIKAATKKAEVAAAKAGREAEATAKRAEAAKQATAKAEAQAAKRAEGSTTAKATAAKAAEENPQVKIVDIKPNLSEQEQKALKPFLERHKSEMKALQKTIDDPATTPAAKTEAEDKMRSLLQGDRKTDIGPPKGTAERRGVTKVPAGETGPKVRAKAGQPASLAQQAADRERQAAKRELSKKEEFGAALEKHAQEMVGRVTSGSLANVDIVTLEDTVKELPNGEYMLKTLQKAKRVYKWNDEIYRESVMEWLKNQFEKMGDHEASTYQQE